MNIIMVLSSVFLQVKIKTDWNKGIFSIEEIYIPTSKD